METKYQPTAPAGLFVVEVTRTLVHDTKARAHYEFSYTVTPRETSNSFINLFAALVCRYGNLPAKTYAAMMGIDSVVQFQATLQVLTGAGINEWADTCALAVSEALLRETDWEVRKIAEAARFRSSTYFSRWFRKKHKCSPQAWR